MHSQAISLATVVVDWEREAFYYRVRDRLGNDVRDYFYVVQFLPKKRADRTDYFQFCAAVAAIQAHETALASQTPWRGARQSLLIKVVELFQWRLEDPASCQTYWSAFRNGVINGRPVARIERWEPGRERTPARATLLFQRVQDAFFLGPRKPGEGSSLYEYWSIDFVKPRDSSPKVEYERFRAKISDLLTPDASPPFTATGQALINTVCRSAMERFGEVDLIDCRVDTDSIYQPLPLLREIDRQHLPSSPILFNTASSSRTALRATDLHRWEERIFFPNTDITYETHALDDVITQSNIPQSMRQLAVPRLVLLGPPGSGKTTLLHNLALRAGRRELTIAGKHPVPVYVHLPRWHQWTSDPPRPSLADYLTVLHPLGLIERRPAQETWNNLLEQGQVLLLLDGLDELPLREERGGFRDELRRILKSTAFCPTVVSCRTISRQRYHLICPDFSVFVIGPIDRPAIARFVSANPLSAKFDTTGLLTRLDTSASLFPLASNPLLLSILCYVASRSDDALAFGSRTQLYESAISYLLRDYVRQTPERISESVSVTDRRAILRYLAVELFLGTDGRFLFNEDDLSDALKSAASAAGHGDAPGRSAQLVQEDLLQNSGLIRGNADSGYSFLHLTFIEYLVANALAEHINDPNKGWDKPLQPPFGHCRPSELIRSKVWDPTWEEVIVLLAGQLSAPTKLLSFLAGASGRGSEPRADDVLSHRSAVAARCIGEIPPQRLDQSDPIVRSIIGTTVVAVFAQILNDTPTLAQHSLRGLGALANANVEICSLPFRIWLREGILSPCPLVRKLFITIVNGVGTSVPAEGIVDALASLLDHPHAGKLPKRTKTGRRMVSSDGSTIPPWASELVALLSAVERFSGSAHAAGAFRFGTSGKCRTVELPKECLSRQNDTSRKSVQYARTRPLRSRFLRDASVPLRLVLKALCAFGSRAATPAIVGLVLERIQDSDWMALAHSTLLDPMERDPAELLIAMGVKNLPRTPASVLCAMR
jgi:DNA polymerase III delta prime subunit